MTKSHSAKSGTGQPITRRGFGRAVGGGILLALLGGLYALRRWYHSQATPPRVIARTEDVPVGGSRIFQHPTDTAPCILVRTGEASYVAYSRVCTHNSCPVFYRADENAFECRCHNGLFSVTDGSVLAGPPPRPLPRILLEIRGNQILAVGIANT